jgi:hypothetical protein
MNVIPVVPLRSHRRKILSRNIQKINRPRNAHRSPTLMPADSDRRVRPLTQEDLNHRDDATSATNSISFVALVAPLR